MLVNHCSFCAPTKLVFTSDRGGYTWCLKKQTKHKSTKYQTGGEGITTKIN